MSGFDNINQSLTDFAKTNHSEEKEQRQFEQQLALAEIQLEKQAESQSRQQQLFTEQLSQHLTQGIAISLEQNMAKLLNFYVEKQNFDTRQTHEQQVVLHQQLTSLTQAVENLAVFLQKSAEKNVQPNTVEFEDRVQALQMETQRQQFAQLASVLQKAIEPIVMRMNEKLQVDINTEQTGKLIVNNLHKLTKIFEQGE